MARSAGIHLSLSTWSSFRLDGNVLCSSWTEGYAVRYMEGGNIIVESSFRTKRNVSQSMKTKRVLGCLKVLSVCCRYSVSED